MLPLGAEKYLVLTNMSIMVFTAYQNIQIERLNVAHPMSKKVMRDVLRGKQQIIKQEKAAVGYFQ